MVVYGVALLSFCMLAGVFLGRLLGYLLGIDANVGGIGIAMLLLIFIANKKSMAIKIDANTKSGINFWNASIFLLWLQWQQNKMFLPPFRAVGWL